MLCVSVRPQMRASASWNTRPKPTEHRDVQDGDDHGDELIRARTDEDAAQKVGRMAVRSSRRAIRFANASGFPETYVAWTTVTGSTVRKK